MDFSNGVIIVGFIIRVLSLVVVSSSEAISSISDLSPTTPSLPGPSLTDTLPTMTANESNNYPFLYQCDDGTFTNVLYTCDGFRDCLDESDEKHCDLVPQRDRFQCTSTGRKSSVWNTCDGHRDCLNGEDEQGCTIRNCSRFPNRESCQTRHDVSNCVHPRKKTLRCLPEAPNIRQWQEGNKTDNAWEYAICEETGFVDSTTMFSPPSSCSTPCNVGEYRCRASGQCIEKSFLCDGYFDCFRGDDEKFCDQILSPHCYVQDAKVTILDLRIHCEDQITSEHVYNVSVPYHPRILALDGFGRYVRFILRYFKSRDSGGYIAVLSLRNNNLSLLPPNLSAAFPSLRVLDLSNNPFCASQLFPRVFARLPLLNYIYLNDITMDALCQSFHSREGSSTELDFQYLSVTVDIQLEFRDCCSLKEYAKSSCNATLEIATCEYLLQPHYRNFLWGLIVGSSIFGIMSFARRNQQRNEDRPMFMCDLSMFVGDFLNIFANLVFTSFAEYVHGNYYQFHQVFNLCFYLTIIHYVSFIVRSLGNITNILVMTLKHYISVATYSKFSASHFSLGYILVLLFLSVASFITVFSTSKYPSYENLCYFPIYEILQHMSLNTSLGLSTSFFLSLSGLTILVSLGACVAPCLAPSGKLRMETETSKSQQLKVRSCNEPATDDARSNARLCYQIWSAVLSAFHSTIAFVLGVLSIMGYLPQDSTILIPLSLYLMAVLPCINPLAYFLASLIPPIIDQPKRKTTLRRTGGFSRKSSIHYEKLDVYLQNNGVLTTQEAFKMALTLAEMLNNFHKEGMVCDSIGTDFVIIGIKKDHITEPDFAAITEYPKSDVQEWRTKRDILGLGMIMKSVLGSIVPAKNCMATDQGGP